MLKHTHLSAKCAPFRSAASVADEACAASSSVVMIVVDRMDASQAETLGCEGTSPVHRCLCGAGFSLCRSAPRVTGARAHDLDTNRRLSSRSVVPSYERVHPLSPLLDSGECIRERAREVTGGFCR